MENEDLPDWINESVSPYTIEHNNKLFIEAFENKYKKEGYKLSEDKQSISKIIGVIK